MKDEPEIKLIVPQTINITRSFSKKVNPSNYNISGHNYESIDFFASYGDQVPGDSTQEQMQKISNELYLLAKSDVEDAASGYIRDLKGTIPMKLTSKDIKEIAPIIQKIVDGDLKPGGVIHVENVDLNSAQTYFLDKLLNG